MWRHGRRRGWEFVEAVLAGFQVVGLRSKQGGTFGWSGGQWHVGEGSARTGKRKSRQENRAALRDARQSKRRMFNRSDLGHEPIMHD